MFLRVYPTKYLNFYETYWTLLTSGVLKDGGNIVEEFVVFSKDISARLWVFRFDEVFIFNIFAFDLPNKR